MMAGANTGEDYYYYYYYYYYYTLVVVSIDVFVSVHPVRVIYQTKL